ncbi:MAG: esterase-like activity of phytase family protein [Pseudomonadota bacterium]
MRALLVVCVTLLGALGAALATAVQVPQRQIEHFSPRPIPGARLAFRGGLVLRGPRRLGALSGLLVEGPKLLAVSDTGEWVTGRLVVEQGRLKALNDVQLFERLDTDGAPVRAKRPSDAEALAREDNAVLVLVEQATRLLSYPADGLAVDFSATPTEIPLSREEMRAGSEGIEALTRLSDGKILGIAEARLGEAKTARAFILGGRRVLVRRRDGFAITGADTMPGGDVFILERRYGGGLDVAMRVRRLGVDAFNGGPPADGPILLEADFSAEIDNMEGIAVEGESGEIVLTMVSDNNRSFLQRTLLLRFVVSDPRPRPNPLRVPQQPVH